VARNMYGATSADFTLTSGGRVVPGATLTIWSARTGGTQITDLLDVDSVATTTVTSDADGSIVYYGPNDDKTVHWADSGVGGRIAIRPVDITGDPPVLSIGTVGTGTAAASLTGTSEAPVLNLTLPSAGANGVNTAAIQDNAVTSAKIADGTIATADIADGAVTYAKLGADVRIGNLLTPNQASGTGGGWYGINATFDTTTDSGDTVGRYTLTATGAIDFANLLASAAFAVGETRTTLVDVKSSRSQDIRLSSNGYDAGWSGDDNLPTRFVTVAANTWTTIAITGTPAAAKAYVGVILRASAGQSGDVILVRRASIHRGADGLWAPPGTVIPGTSHIATNGAFQTSGTVAPEGVITAPPLSRYQQTSGAATVTGAMEWVKATGTGNTGWVAGAEADTGWRDVSASFTGGYTSPSALVRRVGNTVQVRCYSGTTPTLINNDWNTLVTLDAGFRPAQTVDPVAWNAGFAGDMRRAYITTAGVVRVMGAGATVASLTLHATFTTTDAWPSSLPGSPA